MSVYGELPLPLPKSRAEIANRAGADALIKPFGRWRNPEAEGSRNEAPHDTVAPASGDGSQ